MAGAVRRLEVRAGLRRYEVLIGAGLCPQTGALVRQHLPGERCAVISDANVAPLYGATVCASLRQAGYEPALLELEPGEKSKSLQQVEAICARLGAAGLDRTSFLISLGGGVLGDLVGFVASVYLRGIPCLALPTTLLAQVDSCIGGKTGVNAAAGKNLIGSFYHPSLVLADTDTLRTLPVRIWNEGFAEVIKHGIIRDAELFALVAQASPLPASDEASWQRALPQMALLVERSLAIKAAIVAADEHEQTGVRALLNFGHTIGHAVEHAAGYGYFLHGEAVSLGMVAAVEISLRRAGLSLGEAAKIRAALQAHDLPIALPPDFPREKILAALPRDKKFAQGRIRFVVTPEIGRASLADNVTKEDLRAAVASL